MENKSKLPQLLMILLMAFHLLMNIVWLLFNKSPFTWDEAAHAQGAFEFGYFFSQAFRGNLNIDLLLYPLQNPYPPFMKMLTGFLTLFIYPSIGMTIFVSTAFFLGQIYILFLIVKEVYKSEWLALLSVFVYSFLMVVYDRSRVFSLDMGVTFFVLFAVYMYVKSQYLKHWRQTLLFFIAIALSLLTKLQSALYFIPLFLHYAYLTYKNKTWLNTARTILIGTGIILVLTLPWVLLSLDQLNSYFSIASQSQQDVTEGVLSLVSMIYYARYFTFGYLGFFASIVILVLFVFLVLARNKQDYLFLSYVLLLYLLLSLYPNKNYRFLLPLAPFVALLFSRTLSILYSKVKFIGISVISFITFNFVFMYFGLSFNFPFSLQGNAYLSNHLVSQIDMQEYPYNKIAEDINSLYGPSGGVVFNDFNKPLFNINTLNMYFRLYNMPVMAVQPSVEEVLAPSRTIPVLLSSYQYFFYSPNGAGNPWYIDKESNHLHELVWNYLTDSLNDGSILIVNKYNLPDNLEVWLLIRNQ
jgi:4-amino-4-deoxy-L-arabinose transferase-like glycosyltransferase